MAESSDYQPIGGKKSHRTYRVIDKPTGVAFGANNCTSGGRGAPAGTTFTNKGAQKLTNVHVLLIFWGTQWAGSPNPLAAQVTSAVENLLDGPYMSYLAQYGVHRGSLWGTKFVLSDPPNPFSGSQVGQFIIDQLDADNLPEPDSNWPIFYCVIMPSNTAFQGIQGPPPLDPVVPLPSGTVSNILGANSRIEWDDIDFFEGDKDTDPALFAWIGNDGTVDYITTVLSHELVEACTDPGGGNGIVQAGAASVTGQIGDPCTGICDRVRGVKVWSYWSQLDISDLTINPNRISRNPNNNGGCVVPKFYSVRRTLAGRNINGHIGSLQSPIPSLNQLIKSLF